MSEIQVLPKLKFLSELYREDCPGSCLLAEYPSSNSDQTVLQNFTNYIIHDPFPAPRRELLKVLGPHHLMCCWGDRLPVCSEVQPPEQLVEHWENVFGGQGCPVWKSLDTVTKPSATPSAKLIPLFPHQSLPAEQQVVDPDVNYRLHSKEVIEKIDCPQAEVLQQVSPPCVVKLSHGYAGLGNFFIQNQADEVQMRRMLDEHWPTATLVINSIVENIKDDFGVQFYIRKDGSLVWLGLTEQRFDDNSRWCGGTFTERLQCELLDQFRPIVEPTGRYLHEAGYFGVVGVDILRDTSNRLFLVDVNPRLTGISPFLMASRIFAGDGLSEGIYQASRKFNGSMEQLFAAADSINDARVLVLSAFEESETSTVCHISASSQSLQRSQQVLDSILCR